jgi:hypothetical protein
VERYATTVSIEAVATDVLMKHVVEPALTLSTPQCYFPAIPDHIETRTPIIALTHQAKAQVKPKKV